MMLWGAVAPLEIRAENGGVRVTGRFPYGTAAELAPGRRETIAPRAFSLDGETLFLFQHDPGRPLASVRAGSLDVQSDAGGLTVHAAVQAGTSWARDFLAAHEAGLITGLSPGFRVAPGGDRVERQADGLLRTVTSAQLIEVSAVTRPAYPTAQLEARSWQADAVRRRLPRRWRA